MDGIPFPDLITPFFALALRSTRFSQTSVLSSAGQILGKTDAFDLETHEACDVARLMKNKKVDHGL